MPLQLIKESLNKANAVRKALKIHLKNLPDMDVSLSSQAALPSVDDLFGSDDAPKETPSLQKGTPASSGGGRNSRRSSFNSAAKKAKREAEDAVEGKKEAEDAAEGKRVAV